MTDDLLDRLKEAHRLWRRPLLREAADRIEQLEAALRIAVARYVELDDKEAAEEMTKNISEALGDGGERLA